MKTIRFVLAVLALSFAAATARAETPASDPMAVAVADRVMAALGGRQQWEAMPCLKWSFGSEVNDTVRSIRRHAWNKHTGWHRVEGKNRQGQSNCIIHKVGEPTGKAWVEGTAIEGDSLARLLTFAQSVWTNDSYWWLMPYKLRDPGVTLKHEGRVEDGERVYDKIALTFDQVGETPGDRYWVYVNKANARVEKWEYILEGREPPALAWTWEDWQEHGGLWFATARRRDHTTVFTRDIEATSTLPPETFERP